MKFCLHHFHVNNGTVTITKERYFCKEEKGYKWQEYCCRCFKTRNRCGKRHPGGAGRLIVPPKKQR
jgi:hypothetical protein